MISSRFAAAAKSRLNAYNAAVCPSRKLAASACSRARAANELITSPTVNNPANVNKYWVSETEKV